MDRNNSFPGGHHRVLWNSRRLKEKPWQHDELNVLQLDFVDRHVVKIAGKHAHVLFLITLSCFNEIPKKHKIGLKIERKIPIKECKNVNVKLKVENDKKSFKDKIKILKTMIQFLISIYMFFELRSFLTTLKNS